MLLPFLKKENKMKRSMEDHIEAFKQKHGDGELKVESNGRVEVPVWLMKMVVHLSGIRSRKRRVLKKVVKREVGQLIQNSLNVSE